MVNHERLPSTAEQKAGETLDRMAHALAEAAAAAEPDERRSLLEIFPEPGERRADTEFNLPPEQEEKFREAMAKLGIGRETNLTATEVGLRDDYVAIIEGGQAHKMVAELDTVLSDKFTKPSAIFVAASPERAIPAAEVDKAKERETTARVLGIDVDDVMHTEYDVAQQIIYKTPGLYPDRVLIPNFGYNLDGQLLAGEATGQFKRIGRIDHVIPVYLLRVDREYSEGGKYRTLGVKSLIRVIDGLLNHEGRDADIGFVTSATYQPSRETDATSAMLEIERQGGSRNVGVITYGTHTLAEVKKETYPAPPALGQLAGEAHKAAKQVEFLRDLLGPEAE